MLAIIPARGGSKRIKGKNIKPFLNKPIISYSIHAALESNLFDTVMVSTDSEEIATVARHFGAEVPFLRSPENSNDHASTVDALLEVLGNYYEKSQIFSLACCIYPTAPFVDSALLNQGYSLLKKYDYDSAFPVIQYSYPIQRALRVDKEGRVSMLHPEHLLSRSQDLESTFHDSGQFYWFRPRILAEKRSLWTDNTGVFPISELRAHDIDTYEDWKIAEFKYKLLLDGKE